METLKVDKRTLADALWARDGAVCGYPDCDEALDPNGQGKMAPTIDHWYPVSWCKEQDWTYDQIWDVSNLRLAHKKCNAAKGSRVPNEDGTLPPRPKSRFVYRKDKRAARPDNTECCSNGRTLEYDEICAVCGEVAQPVAFPSTAQVPIEECPHEYPFSCFACIVGLVPRQAAIVTVLDGTVLDDDRIVGSAHLGE